jgi:NAD/NADP transhydrogenase beta subunit
MLVAAVITFLTPSMANFWSDRHRGRASAGAIACVAARKRVAMTDMPQMIAHLQRHGRRRGGGRSPPSSS